MLYSILCVCFTATLFAQEVQRFHFYGLPTDIQFEIASYLPVEYFLVSNLLYKKNYNVSEKFVCQVMQKRIDHVYKKLDREYDNYPHSFPLYKKQLFTKLTKIGTQPIANAGTTLKKHMLAAVQNYAAEWQKKTGELRSQNKTLENRVHEQQQKINLAKGIPVQTASMSISSTNELQLELPEPYIRAMGDLIDDLLLSPLKVSSKSLVNPCAYYIIKVLLAIDTATIISIITKSTDAFINKNRIETNEPNIVLPLGPIILPLENKYYCLISQSDAKTIKLILEKKPETSSLKCIIS